MAHRAVASFYAQFQVVYLLALRRRLQSIFEILPVRRLYPFHQPVAGQFLFAVTGFEAAPVRIADQSGSVQHKNHALRGIEYLLIEVSFALELRLKHLLLGYIEHQAANLYHVAVGIAHRADVLQRVEEASILSSKRLFVVSQRPTLRD